MPLTALAELAAGGTTLLPPTRRIGAFVGLLTMIVAAALALYAGIAGCDMNGCRCFGPIHAPWWVHVVVAVAVAAPLAMTCSDMSARRPFFRHVRR